MSERIAILHKLVEAMPGLPDGQSLDVSLGALRELLAINAALLDALKEVEEQLTYIAEGGDFQMAADTARQIQGYRDDVRAAIELAEAK